MSGSDVLFDIAGHVATITLDRVSRHNALTMAMLAAIDSALANVEGAAGRAGAGGALGKFALLFQRR